MKVQVIVEIQVHEGAPDYCALGCPYEYAARDATTCYCTLSGKKIRLRWDANDDLLRSVFCKKHEHKEEKPRRTLTLVKSFLDD